MKKEVIIGIDVSKSWLDATVLMDGLKEDHWLRVSNTTAGFSKLVKWISRVSKMPSCDWLVCMEHTGYYSYRLNVFLQQSGIYQSMVNALAIKRSMGVVRGKNDKADSRVIAQYAKRFSDRLQEYKLSSHSLQRLQVQLSQRDRMIDLKQQVVLSTESTNGLPEDMLKELTAQNRKLIIQLNRNIAELDELIQATIHTDTEMCRQVSRITSVPGIGLYTAAYIMVATRCMTRFSNSRKFACYCGVAPFENSSGSSYKRKTRVHPLANKKLKSLLHMGALSAIQAAPDIRNYYQRKIGEGKNPMSVINAVRFKLIDRAFAVVKRDQNFEKVLPEKVA